MNLVIHYEKKDENQDLVISIYLFRYIKVLKVNLTTYLRSKVEEYLQEDDNNLFSIKSYINYKNLLKIIQYRFKELKKHMNIQLFHLDMCVGTNSPAVTAILYGILSGIAPSLIHYMNGFIPVKKYYMRIAPDFNLCKSNVSFVCEIHVNPIFITYQFVSIKRRLKKNE